MPARKSKAPPPTRRSARLASRESSVVSTEEDDLMRVAANGHADLSNNTNNNVAERVKELEEKVLEVARERDESLAKSRHGSMRRELTLKRIHEDYDEKHGKAQSVETSTSPAKKVSEKAVVLSATPRSPPSHSHSNSTAGPVTAEELAVALITPEQESPKPQRSVAAVTVVSKDPNEPEAKPPASSPAAAAAAAAAPPAPPEPPASATSGWRRLVQMIGSPFTVRKRKVDDADEGEAAPSQKRVRTEQSTPKPLETQQQPPRDFTGPSTKNPKLPSSLTTISESTEKAEPLFMSSILENTPSKPSRLISQPKRHLQTPTPKPIIQPSTMPPAPSTTTPRPRRISRRGPGGTLLAHVQGPRSVDRGSSARGFGSNDGTRPWAWERNGGSPPRPKERNADARLEKINRLRQLQKEIEHLQADEDVRDMVAHRAKRVKVDHLPSIPHNRPGDATGTFRVPEIDSDDEMEVDQSVQERENVFDAQMKERERDLADAQRKASEARRAEESRQPQHQHQHQEGFQWKPPPQPQASQQAAATSLFETQINSGGGGGGGGGRGSLKPAQTSKLDPQIKLNFTFPVARPATPGFKAKKDFAQSARSIFEDSLAKFIAV